MEVWSTDSEDEEVCKLTHGEYFIVKVEVLEYEGKCLMVCNDVSEQRGYATDDGHVSDNCFAMKPIL